MTELNIVNDSAISFQKQNFQNTILIIFPFTLVHFYRLRHDLQIIHFIMEHESRI